MSLTSPDAKAVVRALDALTAQVGRIADALTAPTDDGPQYRQDRIRDAWALHRRGLISDRELNAVVDAAEQAPAADEDAQRAARRDSAHNLLARLDRGGLLSPGDSTLLRKHFDAEAREHDTVRSVAAGNKRHVQTIVPEIDRLARELEAANARAEAASRVGTRYMTAAEQAEELLRIAHETSNRSEAERAAAVQRAEQAETELRVLRAGLRANGADPTQIQNLWAQIRLRNRQWREAKRERDQAQAAIERVRALREPIAEAIADYREALCCHDLADDAMRLIRAALDGTEQPTTEAACQHCGHPADWHDQHEGCVGPNGIGGIGSGDCTCTRSPETAAEQPATEA